VCVCVCVRTSVYMCVCMRACKCMPVCTAPHPISTHWKDCKFSGTHAGAAQLLAAAWTRMRSNGPACASARTQGIQPVISGSGQQLAAAAAAAAATTPVQQGHPAPTEPPSACPSSPLLVPSIWLLLIGHREQGIERPKGKLRHAVGCVWTLVLLPFTLVQQLLNAGGDWALCLHWLCLFQTYACYQRR